MITKKAFDEEFKQLLAALSGPNKKLYAVMNNQNGILLNYDQPPQKKAANAETRQTSGLEEQAATGKANRKQSLKMQRNAMTGNGNQKESSKGGADVRASKSLKNGSSKMSMENKEGKQSRATKNKEPVEDIFEDARTDEKAENAGMNIAEMRTMLGRCKHRFQRIYNRLEFNQHLNNKKALFMNMRNYYNYCCSNGNPVSDNDESEADDDKKSNLSHDDKKGQFGGQHVFDTLPLTFHIKSGPSDSEFARFEDYYRREEMQCKMHKHRKNIWIIKPGENSNRGTGIKVESELGKIRGLCGQYTSGDRTMILQKYIDNPLLYQRRKFDIRCFSLVTCINGVIKGYFYRDGYIRTASKEYSLHNLQNRFAHLVNDAVQKYSEDYGKYEPGNKLSYCQLQKYFTNQYPDKKVHLERDIILQIKKIVTDTIRATFHLLDSKKRLNSYELFGYDFMFDDNFKPFLIEVNSNPSLEPSNNHLTKIFT